MAETKKTEIKKPVEGEAPPKPKNQKEQSERFIATARQLDCDESKDAFEKAFTKIVPSKQGAWSR